MEAVYAEKEVGDKIKQFKEKFGICEIVYKVVLEDHQYRKTGEHKDRLKINMNQVNAALIYAGYDFDKDLLSRIFGSEDRIGKRSAKILRDLLTHSLNKNVVDELRNRYDELTGDMNLFLEKIRSFDSEQKHTT